jgi:hypothetical protein
MQLAAHLGMTLGELFDRMPSDEFDLWVALYRRDPWGEQRADLRAGVIASTVANYAGKARSESAGPAKPADFMPYLERQEQVEEEPDPVKFFGAM